MRELLLGKSSRTNIIANVCLTALSSDKLDCGPFPFVALVHLAPQFTEQVPLNGNVTNHLYQ